MRRSVEFTSNDHPEYKVTVVVEDVSAFFAVNYSGTPSTIINVLGGAIIHVAEHYETVKARLIDASR